tara:strand:+ start:22347 stop:23093 length:747 start_codon:yes stop_codon:yes gene_type:complete
MYKNLLYKLLTFFSPNFDKYLSKKFSNSKNLNIVDIGFFKGSFSKSLITKVLKINKEVNISLYSFDPNSNVNMDTFKEFWEYNQFSWKHSNMAIGSESKKETFTILNAFPSSGSSIENILQDSFWYKTRKIFLDPFGNKKNKISNFEIEVETIDNLFTFNDHIDVFKIDVEGYSFEVLQGACEYLKNNSPALQVEILSRKIDFADKEEEIFNYLNNFNYKLISRKQHYTTHLFSDIRCVDYLFEKLPK